MRRATSMKGGFTLVELLVVIGMLMLLAGAVTSSVAQAQRRAKITAATTVVQEMTNAILAYENYGVARGEKEPLAEMNAEPATRSSIAFLLGEKSSSGTETPVLFNAALKNDQVLDPWGKPYRVTIRKGTVQADTNPSQLRTAVAFPNYYRCPAEEN